MKHATFLSAPLWAGILFFMAACGNQSNTDSTTNDTTASADTTTSATTTTSTTTSTSASSIITTPQTILVIRHKVADFNKWQATYEADDSTRLANGLHNYVIGRGLKDSNIVQVSLKVDDLTKAKASGNSPHLKQVMQKGGVVGAPMISYTTITYQDTAAINTDLRSRTTFTVKDWDKWQRFFDSTRQLRKDNGIIDRAYGHDANDPHEITVVVALTDTAKAVSLWKSDAFKKAQAASGMVGLPERFLYRVVKRY